MNQEIVVTDWDEGIRLDLHLVRNLGERFSRARIQKLIREGHVRVGGRQVTAHYKVKPGDKIQVQWLEPEPDETGAEEIPLDILHEDEDIILVNKPAGMVVHPAHGNPRHTLVNALLYYVRHLSTFGGSARPGIVHRLDKDTSGIMVIAKNDFAHATLARQFKNHTMERIYRVAVRGVVQHDEGVCEEPVGRAFVNRKKVIVKPSGGKDALTHYKVLRRFSKATLLEVRPHTGRTHQIRVHMAHLGHPVLGDALYGVASPWIARQAVHAFALGLAHPKTRERKYFECALPQDMQFLLDKLSADSRKGA